MKQLAGKKTSTDSIDFSQPRMVRVYNNSLNAYVTYTVKVNVHQQEPLQCRLMPTSRRSLQPDCCMTAA